MFAAAPRRMAFLAKWLWGHAAADGAAEGGGAADGRRKECVRGFEGRVYEDSGGDGVVRTRKDAIEGKRQVHGRRTSSLWR